MWFFSVILISKPVRAVVESCEAGYDEAESSKRTFGQAPQLQTNKDKEIQGFCPVFFVHNLLLRLVRAVVESCEAGYDESREVT